MLTSCSSFLIDVAMSVIDLAISSDDLSDDRSFVPTCKIKMIRTVTYRWFYVIVHACCFCTRKDFNKHFIICVKFFGHFPSIKVFYHTVSYQKYRFFILFSFWFVIFVSSNVIVFCGLQLPSIDLTIVMFLLAFLDISPPCLSFWLFSPYCRSILECFYFGSSCNRWFLCFVIVCN